MIVNPVVVGGGTQTAKFTFNPNQGAGTLNGAAISIGEIAELQIGSLNQLEAPAENQLVAESGYSVPYGTDDPIMRAPPPTITYWFVMPNEDVEFKYVN